MTLGALADYAAVTGDQKLVIGGVFDTIVVGQLPATHPSMALAVRLVAPPEHSGPHEVRVRLTDPDGREVVPAFVTRLPFAGEDPVESGTAQFVLQMNNVSFAVAGRHAFDILVDDAYIGSIELNVRRGAAKPGGPHMGGALEPKPGGPLH